MERLYFFLYLDPVAGKQDIAPCHLGFPGDAQHECPYDYGRINHHLPPHALPVHYLSGKIDGRDDGRGGKRIGIGIAWKETWMEGRKKKLFEIFSSKRMDKVIWIFFAFSIIFISVIITGITLAMSTATIIDNRRDIALQKIDVVNYSVKNELDTILNLGQGIAKIGRAHV